MSDDTVKISNVKNSTYQSKFIFRRNIIQLENSIKTEFIQGVVNFLRVILLTTIIFIIYPR